MQEPRMKRRTNSASKGQKGPGKSPKLSHNGSKVQVVKEHLHIAMLNVNNVEGKTQCIKDMMGGGGGTKPIDIFVATETWENNNTPAS